MSFFQNKPTGTQSAFGTPQPTNAFSSFSTPSTAPKPGPFTLSGLGQPTTNTFGQQQGTNQGGGFGFGGNVSQSAGGGFGQSNQQGGLFGQSTGTQGGFGQNTGTGGFGQSGGSGFGAFGQNQGTGVFGQKPGGFGGGGFFTQQNQQQQQQQPQQMNQSPFGGGFLGQQQQPQQSSFGGSTLGGPSLGSSWLQPQQQPQQQIQQQSQITPITRWSDLPASDQKFLEDLEKYITEQKAICENLKTRSPQLEEYISSIPSDVAEVQKRFDTIAHILTVDTTILTNDLKQKFDLLSTQTQQAIRLLEVFIQPTASSSSYLASTHGAGGDTLIDFFLQKTIEWQSRVDSFKRDIAEIDRMVKAVEEGQMSGIRNNASEEILETIRAQWDGFCGLAARVGKLRERAAEVKIAVERGLRGGRL